LGERIFDEKAVRDSIRDIPDYPKPGIIFRDITPILKDPALFSSCIDKMAELLQGKKIDYVAGIESRGFIIGVALAMKLGKGFIPIRKKGKLPYHTISKTYDLEYGSATIEMHRDAVKENDNVLVVDDLLATGGTAEAAAALIYGLKGRVPAFIFLIELVELKGRALLKEETISLLKY
jgi:adenine phosphoribosyltransferase